MDFLIKSSLVAPEIQNEFQKSIDSPNLLEGFFDDYRLLIMSLALLLSVINIIWQIRTHYKEKKEHRTERKEDRYLSIKEDYWHKSVILPMFIDKFVISITNWINTINELKDNETQAIEKTRDSFKSDIRELCSRTHLLCTVNENVREKIRTSLDEIEDCVTAHLSDLKEETMSDKSSSINEKILIKVEQILKELMQDHHQIFSEFGHS